MSLVVFGPTAPAVNEAAREVGLSLTVEQMLCIVRCEQDCLSACGRIVFGPGVAPKVVRSFAHSVLMATGHEDGALREVIEAFYDLRESLEATVTDDEILEALRQALEGEAQGDVPLAAYLAAEALVQSVGQTAYEIADDDGRIYRVDADEWQDDVMADGWYGERWEDLDG